MDGGGGVGIEGTCLRNRFSVARETVDFGRRAFLGVIAGWESSPVSWRYVLFWGVTASFFFTNGFAVDSACLRFLLDARVAAGGAAPEAAVSAPIVIFFLVSELSERVQVKLVSWKVRPLGLNRRSRDDGG